MCCFRGVEIHNEIVRDESMAFAFDKKFPSSDHAPVVAEFDMGAHAAGELASRMATDHIAMNYFRLGNEQAADALHLAVHESNAEIYQRGQQNPEFYNMGTTASSLAIFSCPMARLYCSREK